MLHKTATLGGMEDMAKLPCLFKRKGTSSYYYRKRIPEDLRGVYGKQEIIFSLRTSDIHEAARKVHLASLKYDREFEEHRKNLAEREREGPKRDLSNEEIRRIAEAWVHEQMAQDEQQRIQGGDEELFRSVAAQLKSQGADYTTPFPTEGDGWNKRMGLSPREMGKANETNLQLYEDLSTAVAQGNVSYVDSLVGEVLEEHDVRLPKDSQTYSKLAYELLKAFKDVVEMQQARLAGEVVDTPEPPEQILDPKPETGPTLSEIFEKWKVERKPPEKTAFEFATYIKRFIGLHGDLPIEEITKAHVREYKEAMLLYPSRASSKLKKLPIHKVIEKTRKDESIPRLSVKTVNEKCLATLSLVFSWAVNNGYRDDNPAQGIRAVTGRAQQKQASVFPYTIEDLNRIFHFPVFTGNDRPKAGAGEAARWLPLLALFTGARLEELGQLDVTDVKQDAGTGIWYLDINNGGDGKHVKTSFSVRKIPVHPELIELGFLRYHKEMSQQGHRKLFPLLKPGAHGRITGEWSKWWGRYARRHGITEKGKVFHSFRHTAKDGFRDAGISKPVYDAIQGHAPGDVSDTYGRGYNLKTLYEAVKKLEYPGLDLSHLVK